MSRPFRLSANISMLFTELPFLDRIDAAADAGFMAVECQFPYATSAEAIAERLEARGVAMNSINTPMGDPAMGEFGFAALPGRKYDFRAGFEQALAYGKRLGVSTIHCMSGVPSPEARTLARQTFLDNLHWAALMARVVGIDVVIEPLNSRDRPGYFVSRSDGVANLLRDLDEPNVKLLFDIYHIQIMEGDLLRRMEKHWPIIGHVQIASVPNRHEPDEGEIAFSAILSELTARGWNRFVGAEYNPRGATLDGLAWARPWLGSASPGQ
jgi:hydroxypyruvate isomerase